MTESWDDWITALELYNPFRPAMCGRVSSPCAPYGVPTEMRLLLFRVRMALSIYNFIVLVLSVYKIQLSVSHCGK